MVGVLAGICDDGVTVSPVQAGPAAVPAGSDIFAKFTPEGSVNLVTVVQVSVSGSDCVHVVSDLPLVDVCDMEACATIISPSATTTRKTLFISSSSTYCQINVEVDIGYLPPPNSRCYYSRLSSFVRCPTDGRWR